MTVTEPQDPLDLIPKPRVIQERLGKLLRAERHLRRQLRLSLAAQEERREEQLAVGKKGGTRGE